MTHHIEEPPFPPRMLERVLDITSAPSGTATLAAAVSACAELLGVQCVFVGGRSTEGGTRIRTLAMCLDGEPHDPIEYDLADTPCEDVYGSGACFVPCGVQEAYPRDAMLVDMGAQAYLGRLFFTPEGDVVGHVGLIHREPLPRSIADDPAFRLFSGLAEAELARMQAEHERLALERSLHEARRLESLGLLAGGLAHDMNNLLTGITARVDVARTGLAAGSPTGAHLDAIGLAARRVAELTRQMLAYSGRGRFLVQVADLGALTRELVSLLRSSLPATVELTCDGDEQLPGVEADVTQLRQLIMNLVLNAAEALGEEPGRVAVSVAAWDGAAADTGAAPVVGTLPAGRCVRLVVEDDGPGIAPDVREQIFEPFFTTKPNGSGLGLAAVHGIVRAHHGALRLDSGAGGTRFELLLPASEGAVAPVAGAAPGVAVDLAGRSVLVVDDEEIVRSALATMLDDLGARAVLVDSGEAALARHAATDAAFDLVLLDLTMPGLDGHAVLEELGRRDAGLPVVLMSGYMRRGAAGRGGSVPFLQKPFTRDELLAVAAEALRV